MSRKERGDFTARVFCIQSFVKKIISWKYVERVVNYAHRIPEDGFRRRMAVEADTDRCRPRSEKYS